MSGAFGRAGGLRPRLYKLVLASVLACVLPALAADAALAGDANMRPSIQGYGQVTTTSYGCFNFNQDDRSLVTNCGTRFVPSVFSFPTFTDAVIVMVATPFSNNGNQFSRWDGCTNANLPIGTIGSAVAAGNVCTLTVSFFSAVTPTLTPRAVFDDVAGPVISSVNTNFNTITDRGVSFGVNSNESMSAIECSVDNGAFSPCGSVRTFSEGTHQVRARSFDLSGNLGNTTANQSFRIVDTALVSGPADFSAVKRPTFVYSTLAGLSFECSMDGAAFTACGAKDPTTNRGTFPQPTDLPDGNHTFRVRGVDGPEFDRVPLTRTWKVDTTAPVITGLASPTITDGIVTTALNAAFTWGVTEVGGLDRFECQLDSGGFEPCASGKSFSDLPFGGHTFTVRGRDKAGNVGPSVTRSWTVAARDEDGDGFNQRSDCNDGNPRINPIAPDVPDNGVDENCDGADAVNLDRDGDGFQRPADCDDANPSIKPGVRDIPDNNIDENCDGSDAKSTPPTRIVVSMPFFVKKSTNKFTTFTQLQVKGIPQGSRLKVVCKAPKKKKCPAGNTFTKRNAGGTVNLSKWLKKKLLAGTTLTVTVTKPGNFIGAVKTMTIKKKARPSFVDRCAAPGTTKAIRC